MFPSPCTAGATRTTPITARSASSGRTVRPPPWLAELRAGLEKLQNLYPAKLQPVLVPPWNRIDAALLPRLAALGFRAVSVYGEAQVGPIGLINTHVDIMDWTGTRGCRPHAELVGLLVGELERASCRQRRADRPADPSSGA